MSSVWYQFVSLSQTGLCKSRSCDFCGLEVVRLKAPPPTETTDGLADFPRNSFEGWSSYSRRLKWNEEIEAYDEIHADFCAGCTEAVWDRLIDGGIVGKILDRALNNNRTIYLDAFGQPVESRAELEPKPACIWRAEGKIGIRPCRRVRQHEGECSVNYEPGYIDCPVCSTDRDWDASPGSALLFSERALENHAVVEHGIIREPSTVGMYVWRTPHLGNGHANASAATALILLQDTIRNRQLWGPR